MRMLLSAVLLAALLLPAGPAGAAGSPFSDDDGTPYEDAIEALAAKDIVSGCDDGDRFCPGEPLRRDQAASLLVRAFDLPASARDFFDDDRGSVHEDAINRLAAAGVSLGCSAHAYCGGRTLQRGQVAALLVRAGDVGATDERFFRDVRGTHAGAINRLAAAGITGGCNDSPARFCPGREVVRGEMALFLARSLDLDRRTELQPLPDPEPKRKAATRRKAPAPSRQRTSTDPVWDRLARCESGGNWSINTGNGYYGGLQFSLQSWRGVGGTGYPHEHSREEQIKRGEMLKANGGWGHWPSCAAKLGLL